jgi:hypothetical protein
MSQVAEWFRNINDVMLAYVLAAFSEALVETSALMKLMPSSKATKV